jgi:hypothetical protein
MLSVNAMMKTLLMGSGGNFSLLTQSTVVLMDEEGLHEMIGKDKIRLSKAPNNFALFIFELLSGSFLGIPFAK